MSRSTPAPAVTAGLGIVLGGGGAVGTAYLAGALRALLEADVDVHGADLLVGTSAGALVAAQLRKGASPHDVLALAHADPGAGAGRPAEHYEAAWTTRPELYRRAVGASAVLARSFLRAPLPMPSAKMERRFPGGLYRIRDRERFDRTVPEGWPDKPLWLMAVDLATGRRAALGSSPEHRQFPLREAVRASCAVPGFYEPVHIAGRRYVDGGVRSTTSLDRALRFGCGKVVCIAPLGYWSGPGVPARQRVLRSSAVRALRRELAGAGERANDVLLIQPLAADLALHGTNLLRASGHEQVADSAYVQTRALLGTPRGQRFLSA